MVEAETTARAATGNGLADQGTLVERARRGDAAAWTLIYQTCQPAVFRYVSARIFDVSTAEDLTSTVFVVALKSIRNYRDQGKPMLAWLYGIGSRVIADHRRATLGRTGVRARLGGLLHLSERDESEAIPLSGAAPTEAPDSAASLDRFELAQAMEGLTADQREVVTMRFFVGLTTDEIAEMLGKKPAAVYSLEARALAALRKRMVDQGN